jgi:hypothetical protein
MYGHNGLNTRVLNTKCECTFSTLLGTPFTEVLYIIDPQK